MSIKDNCYLLIAGLTLKVIFKPSSDPQLGDKFKKWVSQVAGNFITERLDNIDFTIEVEDKPEEDSKNDFVVLNKKKSRKITAFYNMSMWQLQITLQNVIYRLLSESDGFFLHSSASLIRGKAYLFLGESGHGKSTAVQLLSKEFRPLSDDLSIIRKVNGKFLFFQHPLFEKNRIIVKTSEGYDIAKFLFLEKANNFEIKILEDKEEVLSRLYGQIRAPDKKNLRSLMEVVSEFNDFYTLKFAKDPEGMIKFFEV